jgi:hypothetical protein
MIRISRFYSFFLLATIIGCYFAPSAQAQDWFYFISSDKDVNFFLDRDSISRKENFVGVTVFHTYSKVEDGVIAVIARREYNCKSKNSRITNPVSLYEDQSVRLFKEVSVWEPIKRDSVEFEIFKKMCNVE